MFDKNLQLQLGDGSSTIILNTRCSPWKTPEKFEAFYDFVNTGKVDERDEFVQYLGKRVAEANEDEEIDRIMTLDEEMRIRWDRAMKKGEELGFVKGMESGFAKGEESGFAKGEESGAAKERLEIAKKLKEYGISADVIAKNTNLSPKVIEEL